MKRTANADRICNCTSADVKKKYSVVTHQTSTPEVYRPSPLTSVNHLYRSLSIYFMTLSTKFLMYTFSTPKIATFPSLKGLCQRSLSGKFDTENDYKKSPVIL